MAFKYTCVVLLLCVTVLSVQGKHVKENKSKPLKGNLCLWFRIIHVAFPYVLSYVRQCSRYPGEI